MNCFTTYHPDKSVTMLNLSWGELMGKIEEYEVMVDNYTPNKILDKIKRIGLEKLIISGFWLIQMINNQMILL